MNWAVIDAELRGHRQFVAGEEIAQTGEAEEIVELEEYLSRLGMSLEDSEADIRAAIEKEQNTREYGQAGRDSGGRQTKVQMNAHVVIEPLMLKNLMGIESYRQARDSVEKGMFTNASGDSVLISNEAVKKWYSRNANALKRNLAPHLVEAFKRSVTYHRGGGWI